MFYGAHNMDVVSKHPNVIFVSIITCSIKEARCRCMKVYCNPDLVHTNLSVSYNEHVGEVKAACLC